MKYFLSILAFSFVFSSHSQALEFTALVDELKECVSTHNLSEETCATLMSIYYSSQQSTRDGVQIDFYYSDYSCSSSNFVAGIFIDYNATSTGVDSACATLARKVARKRTSVWGYTVDKGSCENATDVSYNSKDQLIKLCKDIYEGNL